MSQLSSTWSRYALRGLASIEAGCLASLSALVDVLPSAAQYGVGRTIRNRILATPIRRLLGSTPLPSPAPAAEKAPAAASTHALLVTGSLGTGGVEAIVALLATELPSQGVSAHVLCSAGGATADVLSGKGIPVVVIPDSASASAYLDTLAGELVIQLHNAPDYLVNACIESGRPTVQVLHNTDINLPPERWEREAALTQHCVATVAVSDTVRRFHEQHLSVAPRSPILVIPNGVDSRPYTAADMSTARHELASFLKIPREGATVFVCLARYELQKNIPGMVAGFLKAAEEIESIHLVMAGPPSDWLEYRLADAIRRRSPFGKRVHLLGTSSPRTLLAAADAFLLDSYFEGWPVAVTEAIMAGLPVVMSDVGGAVELVGPGAERGYLVPNPAGSPISMSTRLISRARRRVGDQDNHSALRHAIMAANSDMPSWHRRRQSLATQARSWLTSATMAGAHANLLKRVTDVGGHGK